MRSRKRGSEPDIPPCGISGSDPIVRNAAGAEFSSCRRWRYLLWRRWDAGKPAANFLMLNPSTADEHKLDPTCARARDYAERWGYGALIVTNIFAFRNTSPKQMRAAADPVGPGNDAAILRAAREAAIVVCAWGNHGLFLDRSSDVKAILRKNRISLHTLRLNANDEPAHPLYLPGALTPSAWAAASAP
ncbi:MAG: DUF1643 domain-containing protein [Burkholderiales bacterium]